MQRAPSARRDAVWLTIDAIAWLVSVGMLVFSIVHTNAHNVVPSVIVVWWWGTIVIGIPVCTYLQARQAWLIVKQQRTTVR